MEIPMETFCELLYDIATDLFHEIERARLS